MPLYGNPSDNTVHLVAMSIIYTPYACPDQVCTAVVCLKLPCEAPVKMLFTFSIYFNIPF